MESFPEFLILGKDSKEKGDSFEIFIKDYLSTQGYTNIESKRETAMQIDFVAVDIFSQTTIHGEAKGYRKNIKVNNDKVFSFRSKVEVYKETHNLEYVKPVYVATSNFTWEIEEIVKNSKFMGEIETINGQQLIERLRISKYIPSEDKLNSVIENAIPFKKERLYFLLYNGKLFWLQTFKNEKGKVNYYAIFEQKGDPLNHPYSKQFLNLLPNKIKNLSYIDLDVRYHILEYLLVKKETTPDEISTNLNISIKSIEMNLDLLNIHEKLIKKSGDKYFLTSENEGFRHLFNIFYKLNDPKLMKLLYLSNYFEDIIDKRLINYICSRFLIKNLEDIQKEQLKKLISLFPEALNYCLNTDTTFFQNVAASHKKSKKKKQIGNLNHLLYRFLIQNLYTGILVQYFKNQNMVHSILQEKGLLDHAIYGNIVMLKDFKPYLDFQAKYIVGFRKYVGKGPLKAGSFVTPTNKGQLVSEMAKLIGLKNYEGVIEESDKYLAEPSLEELKPQFLINKGVAYAYLGKFTKAIQIYDDALKFNEQLPTLYANLFRAWFNKYKQAINNQEDYPIIPIYLLRYLNSAKVFLDKFNALELSEEDSKKIKDLENAETDLKTEFSAFYDQCLKGMDLNEIPVFLTLVSIINEDYLEPLYNANTESIDSLIDAIQSKISSDNWNYLANFYKILGKNDKALIAIDKGINRIDIRIDILALTDTKGEILYNLGKFEESLEYFNKVLDIDKDDIKVKNFYAETCWKAAKTYRKLGNTKKFEELRSLTQELIETHCIDEKVKTKIINELNSK